jgi:hypothetical protein
MPTLVYKRTHNGDPDSRGRFGVHDCMGGVRSWAFDSVIGVGGQGAEAERNDIAGKPNWIGVGAHRTFVKGMRNPVLTFGRFRDFETDGPSLRVIARNLARRMYVKKARAVMDFTPKELAEVERILAMVADDSTPSDLGEEVTPLRRRVCRRRKLPVCSRRRGRTPRGWR